MKVKRYIPIVTVASVVMLGAIYLGPAVLKNVALLNAQPNKAAEGFTNFYRAYRAEAPVLPSQYVIELGESDIDIDHKLKELQRNTVTPRPGWRGGNRTRVFNQGMTLKSAFSFYSQAEQMELIWLLPRDYVIKSTFHVKGDLLTVAQTIARSVNNDFKGQVRGWICPSARAIVVTERDEAYLSKNCQTKQI